jgi:hypothetical protein
MQSRNRSAWNEANQTDELSYWSTWIRFWTCQRQAHSIRIQTVGQESQRWSRQWGFQLQQCSGYALVSIWTHPPWYHFCCLLLCSISIHLCPKHLHELALKRIGCYLKQTSDHGMVTNSSSNVCKIDAYPYEVVMSRTTLIPHALRVAWDSSSLLLSVLYFSNQTCRQRQLYPWWKPRS